MMTPNKRFSEGVLIEENLVENVRQELPTLTCNHCNNVIVLNPERVRARGWCEKCDQYICDAPGCNVECFPASEMVHYALNRSRQTGRKPEGGPFLYREQGFKMAEIILPDGTKKLVRQRDVGSGTTIKVL